MTNKLEIRVHIQRPLCNVDLFVPNKSSPKVTFPCFAWGSSLGFFVPYLSLSLQSPFF